MGLIKYTDKDREKDFRWFVDNYDDLYKVYGNCFFAIQNKHILGKFKSDEEALENLSDKYELGTYIIQECNGDESAYTYYNPRLYLGFIELDGLDDSDLTAKILF